MSPGEVGKVGGAARLSDNQSIADSGAATGVTEGTGRIGGGTAPPSATAPGPSVEGCASVAPTGAQVSQTATEIPIRRAANRLHDDNIATSVRIQHHR
jgi:hypothetical protein